MGMDSNAKRVFSKDFTLQEPISEKGIEKAVRVMRSGKLHRYNVKAGETSETSLLEEEFADYMGRRYCLACASCGSAMYPAMKSAGIKPGDTVLCNAYTLAPVPGAIENAGAKIELVEIEEDYTIDLADFSEKSKPESVRWLLLSHMHGHIADMDRIMEICRENRITLIEDCAHTMGAQWNGGKSGSFGIAACFSTQTYKHMNSGEGGLLVTDDPDLISRAIVYSGSYMNYDRHSSRPELSVFEKHKKRIPNYSCRMDNLRASILRFQVADLDRQCERWNKRYVFLENALNSIDKIQCPERDPREYYVGSSIQFTLDCTDEQTIRLFLEECKNRGVELKWFGNREPVGFTSSYESWEYMENIPELPKTNRILAAMCDMRIPLTFDLEDCKRISEIIADVADEVLK